MASIVVCGSVLERPSGGRTALHLQYLVGLRKLGHRVLYLEVHAGDGEQAPASSRLMPPAGLLHLRSLLRRSRVEVPIAWVDPEAGVLGGTVVSQLRGALSDADLLLDIGGRCRLPERALAARRALVDLDAERAGGAPSELEHDLHFSYDAGVGHAPGEHWLATLPPVVPRLWYGPPARRGMPVEVIAELAASSLSTQDFGLRFMLDLPRRSATAMRLALPAGAPAELRGQLTEAGWELAGEIGARDTVAELRRQVLGAQSGLCLLGPSASPGHRAWATVRSAHLLAAGRPLIVWDPPGTSGLPESPAALAVEGLEDAAEAIDRVGRALVAHSGAARDLTARFLDYRVVLPKLLARALPRNLSAVA